MATTNDALEQILLPHFESHQRTSSDSKRVTPVAARVAQIDQKIAELLLNDAVESLSLTSDSNDSTLLQEQVATKLLHFVDCAVATEMTSDSTESIDCVLELAAAVAVSQQATQTLLDRADTYSSVILERVRATACRLVGFLAQYSTSDDFLEVAVATLLPRFTDKSQAVRKAAIAASGHFYADSSDEAVQTEATIDLLEALLYSVQHDPSVSNRVEAVNSLAVGPETIPYIVARVRDVKPKVRLAALQVLREKVNVTTQLEPYQCAELMRSGLTDRCASTKEETSKMIYLGWIKAVKYNPVDLLRQMDVVLHEDECAKAINVILQAAETEGLLQELSDPEIRAFRQGIAAATMSIRTADQAMDAESVFFSRVVCSRATDSKTLSAGQKDALTNKVVPDIPILCEVFERHTVLLMQAIDEDDSELEDSLTIICLQLLLLASMADLEEGSRRHFAAVMKRMLGSVATPDDLVEGCLQALKAIYVTEMDFVDTVTEVVADLSANVDGESDELAENFLVRILSVLSIVLENVSPRLASNSSIADFAKHIVPAVTHSNTLVREAGVSCFGKMGLFTNKETLMSEFKPLMLQVASNAEEKDEIRAQAMLALSDWSMLFAEVLTPCSIDDKMVSFSELVQEMMVHSKPAAVCIAAEVASKLLFAGKVSDSKWLAQLIVLFFDARLTDLALDEEDDDAVKEVGSPVRLQQILSIFFPAYSVKGKSGQEALMESILPLLGFVHAKQTQKKKPRGTKALPIVKMIEYICSTVDLGRSTVEEAASKTAQGQDDMETADATPLVLESSTALLASVQVASFLSKESGNIGTTFLRALCKLLSGADFDLAAEEPKDLSRLKHLLEEELEVDISDATSLRALTLLGDALADVEILDEVEEETDDEQESLSEAFDKVGISENNEVMSPIPDKENPVRVSMATSVDKRLSTDSSVATRSSLRSRGDN